MKSLHRKVSAFLLFALLLLSLAVSDVRAQVEFGNYKLGGSVELGGRFFIEKPSRLGRGYFELYRDYPEGFVLERLNLELANKDMSQFFQVMVTEPGEKDQNFLFRGSRVGVWDLEFEWDQLQHLYSTISPYIDEVRTQWETARVAFTYTPKPEIDISSEYKWISKFGNIPKGAKERGEFSSDPFLERIDYTQHEFNTGIELAQPNYQFRVGYNLSIFENDNKSLALFSNPSDLLSLPPDNMANYVTAGGGVNLPYRSRITGAFSYGWLVQDSAVIPNDSPISGSSNLEVNTLTGFISAVSRPINPLTVKGYYRIYDFHDNANDTLVSALGGDSLRSLHYPFMRQTASADAKWTFPIPVSIDVEYKYDQMNRDYNNGDTTEHTPKVALKATPFNWLNLIGTYSHSIRDGSGYISPSFTAEEIALSKFYAADREQDRVDFVAEIMPLNNLTFSVNYGLANDSYDRNPFGLLSDKRWSAGIDVAWNPISRLSLNAGYMHEQFRTRERADLNSFIDIDPGPILLTNDYFDTVCVGMDLVIIPEKLDFNSRYSYSFADTDFNNSNLPPLKDTISRFESYFRYRFTKNISAKVGYIFEQFSISGDYSRYTFPDDSYDLDGYYKPYTAHMILGMLQYRF